MSASSPQPDSARRHNASAHPRSIPLLPPATLAGLVVAALAAVAIAIVSMQASQSRVVTVRQLTATLAVIE